MAKFRQIYTEFWNDPKVMEEMTPEDRYFYLYILTNPNTTQSGIYQITKKQMAFQLGYSSESINNLIDRFEKNHGLLKYNPETRELAVKKWGKYNCNKGGKPIEDCIKKELKEVKDISLIQYVGEHIENKKIRDIFSMFISDSYNDTYNESGDDTSTTRDDIETIRGRNGGKNEESHKTGGLDDTCTDTSTIRGQEEEKEEEETIIREEEEEKEKKKKESAGGSKTFKDVVEFFNKNINPATPVELEKIMNWMDKTTPEIIIRAIEEAVVYNKKSLSYINAILANWTANKLKTISDVENYMKNLKKKIASGGKKGGFCDFEQRAYDGSDGGITLSELEKKLLGIWKDDNGANVG